MIKEFVCRNLSSTFPAWERPPDPTVRWALRAGRSRWRPEQSWLRAADVSGAYADRVESDVTGQYGATVNVEPLVIAVAAISSAVAATSPD